MTTPIDIWIGSRIRARRLAVGYGLQKLADIINLSRVQLGKLEDGTNRTTAARLYDIGKALGTHPGWFFDEFVDGLPPKAEAIGRSATIDSMHVASAYRLLPKDQRRAVRAIISGLSKEAATLLNDAIDEDDA